MVPRSVQVDRLFQIIDYKGDGFIDKYEFAEVFRQSSRSVNDEPCPDDQTVCGPPRLHDTLCTVPAA